MISFLLAAGLTFFWGNEFYDLLNQRFDAANTLAEFLKLHIPVITPAETGDALTHILNRQELVKPIQQLAFSILRPLSFVLLFVIAHFVILLFFRLLNYIVSGGILGSFNRILGMGIVILETLLIFTLIVGFALPPLEFAAKLDIMGTAAVYGHIEGSWLIKEMRSLFENLTAMIGNMHR